MFTGIVEEIGTVAAARKSGGGIRLAIEAPRSARELSVNDSVAVSGVCQTVVARRGHTFEMTAVEETLRKTTLGALRKGSRVNIELPMRLNERLGGHLVLGHVDAVGNITGIEERASSRHISVRVPQRFLQYIVPIGSIAVNGVSLTIAEVEGDILRVTIIPHTLEQTTFGSAKAGDLVNLEFDVVGKYCERLMAPHLPGGGAGRAVLPWNAAELQEMGF